MTPTQVDRAKILSDALATLPQIKKGNAKKGDRTGLTLTAHKAYPFVVSANLDTATGRKVLDAAEKIIRAELKTLGVSLRRRRRA